MLHVQEPGNDPLKFLYREQGGVATLFKGVLLLRTRHEVNLNAELLVG